MRSILEKAIVHLLNGDQTKAEMLFHKFMVEKARSIHESLRQGEDVELRENWDSEIREEEYFDDSDLGEEGEEDEGVGDPDAGMTDGTDTEAMGDEMGGDPEMGGDDMGDDMGGDPDAVDDEGLGDVMGDDDLGDKIENLEDKIDELTAEFDRMMSKMGDEEEDLGDLEGEEGDLEGDVDDLDADMDADADLGGEGDLGAEPDTMGGEDTGDIADRMEDDMGDETQPEHQMAEDAEMGDDDEMLEDITESVLAELDKIAAPSNSEGKEVGSDGKQVSGNRSSMLPSHSVDQRYQQAKPYMVKAQGDAHNDSFERESSPPTKSVTARRNNNAGVKKLKSVPKDGDSSALINKDFAGGHPATKSITAGKTSTK